MAAQYSKYTNLEEKSKTHNYSVELTKLLGGTKISKYIAFFIVYTIVGVLSGGVLGYVIGKMFGFVTQVRLHRAKEVCKIIGREGDAKCIHKELTREQLRQNLSKLANS